MIYFTVTMKQWSNHRMEQEQAKRPRGRQKGYVSEKRKWQGERTKIVRVPESLDVMRMVGLAVGTQDVLERWQARLAGRETSPRAMLAIELLQELQNVFSVTDKT
jgi:hypothetical protein